MVDIEQLTRDARGDLEAAATVAELEAAKIAHLGLLVLADDAAYFPRYDAVLLYRLDLF